MANFKQSGLPNYSSRTNLTQDRFLNNSSGANSAQGGANLTQGGANSAQDRFLNNSSGAKHAPDGVPKTQDVLLRKI